MWNQTVNVTVHRCSSGNRLRLRVWIVEVSQAKACLSEPTFSCKFLIQEETNGMLVLPLFYFRVFKVCSSRSWNSGMLHSEACWCEGERAALLCFSLQQLCTLEWRGLKSLWKKVLLACHCTSHEVATVDKYISWFTVFSFLSSEKTEARYVNN